MLVLTTKRKDLNRLTDVVQLRCSTIGINTVCPRSSDPFYIVPATLLLVTAAVTALAELKYKRKFKNFDIFWYNKNKGII